MEREIQTERKIMRNQGHEQSRAEHHHVTRKKKEIERETQ